MTPQLRQAIKLLQLSTLDLRTEIQEQLDSNMMLEMDEDQSELPHTNEQSSDSDSGNAERDGNSDNTSQDNDTPDPTLDRVANEDSSIPDELPVDTDWSSLYDTPVASRSSAASDDGVDYYEIAGASRSMNLQEHLLWQLDMATFSDSDREIALALIDSVDDRGYLQIDLEETVEALNQQSRDGQLNGKPLAAPIDLDDVESVLKRIQRFDPLGVAARSPSECLSIQLGQLDPETPALGLAKRITDDFLSILGSGDLKRLTRRLRVDEAAIREAAALIRQLDPYPGEQFSDNTAEYVVPDVFVTPHKGGWRVELNPETSPRLRVNDTYASYVQRGEKGAENATMKEHLQEARWFIKSLQSRNETLLKVATAIVERQTRFLEIGDEGMQPMVLRDIAEQVDMHESTISRVTTLKYMHTPRGIYEFKYFFSSHVGTSDGGECSATAIRAKLKTLIGEENPSKPLSDNKLAQMLAGDGIEVARRTVAKYRESMNIPPSNERKRLC